MCFIKGNALMHGVRKSIASSYKCGMFWEGEQGSGQHSCLVLSQSAILTVCLCVHGCFNLSLIESVYVSFWLLAYLCAKRVRHYTMTTCLVFRELNAEATCDVNLDKSNYSWTWNLTFTWSQSRWCEHLHQSLCRCTFPIQVDLQSGLQNHLAKSPQTHSCWTSRQSGRKAKI